MPTSQRATRGTAWLGYAACVWALGFAVMVFLTDQPERGGWGLTLLPTGDSPTLWLLQLAASLLIPAGGVIALALTQPWGANFPRPLLLTVVWTGAALALAQAGYGVFGSTRSDPWQTAWFVVMGLLLATTGLLHRRPR
ncbi:hypothetical protein [Crossiella sp. CA198]|uniref:hypothetical protein n=1 Tax=Crossiella sp. CA198 TaxID=3455607 RepID=UPI003F8D720E